MASDFDVIIIGAGPAGYVAAIRASQLNLKVAIVEREHLGGICLNWGCIPTKALLRSAEIYRLMQHAKDFGLSADNISFDLTKIVERSRGIAKQLNGGIGHLLKKNKVTNISGTATVKGGGKLSVKASDGKETVYNTKNIIIATGARARELPHLGVDGKQVVTYKNAMTPEVMPKSLLVIGSGAIGIEFASFYNTFGVDVTVVEMADRILPVEDAEISATAEKSFKGQGMKIITNASVDAVSKAKDGVTCSVKNAKTGKTDKIKVDRVISAVGIVPNTEGLGLEALNIKTERGHIVIDGFGKTNIDGVYAIGDVTPGPWLAHKASHEAILCIDKIAGLPNLHPMDKSNIPGCTYCHPQIASVGLTEEKAKAAGHEIRVGRFPFMANGKAIALGEPEGLVKTIFDAKTGALLGAHMVGAEVTEMIQGYVIARQLETTEAELMHTVFPHPTLSEMMHESVLDAFGRAIHF
ncbi:MAG: dihydrolipoamide dehydrogenase [Alphaproteobacteria bacterium]|jgi:dihydrolipoamide dehydrogenase